MEQKPFKIIDMSQELKELQESSYKKGKVLGVILGVMIASVFYLILSLLILI